MLRSLSHTVKGKKANLYILSDFHLGAKGFVEEALKNRVNEIKKDKDAVVIINGDLCDFIRAGDPRFMMSEVDMRYLDFEQQYFGIKEILSPIKDKIIMVGTGNHDFSVKKYHGFDIPRMLSEAFDAFHFEDIALLKIKVKKQEYRVLVTHGSTGSATLGGAVNWLLKRANMLESTPDICAMGHVHRLDIVTDAKLRDDLTTTSVKFLAMTGSYYKTYNESDSNYGSRKTYAPYPIGCVMFELDSDGMIKDNKIIEYGY